MKDLTCRVCSIKQIDGVFITSIGKPLTPEQLKYKVCQYAKKSGCINPYTGAVPKFQEQELSREIIDLYLKNNNEAI